MKTCRVFWICFLLLCASLAHAGRGGFSLVLNGQWEAGFNRHYDRQVTVPGIVLDPARIADSVFWYRRQLVLPGGDWNGATLELKGARFRPQVYINGVKVSEKEGGMGPTYHELTSAAIKPGSTITLEIALQPLSKVPTTDASFIPQADQWRSNVSSSLWDDVVLHLHRNMAIERVIPFYDLTKETLRLTYNLKNNGHTNSNVFLSFSIADEAGKVLLQQRMPVRQLTSSVTFHYKNKLALWSPERPTIYQLKTTLEEDDKIAAIETQTIGIKEFKTTDKQFFINKERCTLRGGTVVWHRWVRSEEGRKLGYDTAWFHKNIIQRLKDHGANYLRFHLGKPPEALLDLCDRYGLLVQYEWSFFHGMPATKESLLEQYRYWLDLAMRHPSVALIHPYNETEGEQLAIVWNALDTLLKNYPPLVLEERDVMHIHKYWWSLFENLGLYYDDAAQFPKTIMVDEFGGNYLDGQGNLGGYKALKESYLRFLGRSHDTSERLAFHAQSNARVAEYWRRIGAAGFAPFCILGSWEDGNHWFMEMLEEGKPKPVWNELTAAFSPLSVSMDIWDRNYVPSQKITVPLYFFNESKGSEKLKASVQVIDASGKQLFKTVVLSDVLPFGKSIKNAVIVLPAQPGNYTLKAELINKQRTVTYPVVSQWPIHVFHTAQEELKNFTVGVLPGEKELTAFLTKAMIPVTDFTDTNAHLIIGSRATWKKLTEQNNSLLALLERAINRGCSIILLDAGERYLGQGYPEKADDLGPLQGVAKVTDPRITNYPLFKGVSITFTEAAEPESHLHAAATDSSLWNHLPKDYTWLWNGMRGGLIVPAADMDFHGLSADALLQQWKARGADTVQMKSGRYYAYELQGFFAFSADSADKAVEKKLKDKVAFLVQDAPALANAINPATPVRQINLHQELLQAEKGEAVQFISLASCGKNLTRTPVSLVTFGSGKGKLIVSQLLTAGRLDQHFGEPGFYGVRYDETARQMVLNMIGLTIQN